MGGGGDGRRFAPRVPWRLLLLVLLLPLALGLRLAGIAERGPWLDELVSLHVASHPGGEIARGEVFDNHTPPLYYLVLRLWFTVVPESVLTLRLLSVLLDLGCLALLVGAVARGFPGAAGRRLALTVGATYAIAPFAVRLAQEGRMYPLLLLLVVACFALAVEVDRRRDRSWPAIALVPVAAAAVYTHYYAALSLVALHAVMAWHLRGDPAARRRWWAAMAVAALLFVPWLPVVADLLAQGGQPFRAFGVVVVPYAALRFLLGFSLLPTTVTGKQDLAGAVLDDLLLLALTAGVLAAALLPGLGRALAAGRRASGRRGAGPSLAGRLAAALFLVPPCLALAVALVVPSLDERYLSICFPFFLVLGVLGLASWRRGRGWRGALAWGVRGTAAGLLVTAAAAQVAAPDAGTTAWSEAAAALRRQAPEGAPVLVRPPYYEAALAANLWHSAADAERWPVLGVNRSGIVSGGQLNTGGRAGGWRRARLGEGWGTAGTGPAPRLGTPALPAAASGTAPPAMASPGLASRDLASPEPVTSETAAPASRGSTSPAPAPAVWLVEAAFLTAGEPFAAEAWRAEEHLLLPAGNGLRLSRLQPVPAPVGEEGGASRSTDPP